jgi:hypothetical protein
MKEYIEKISTKVSLPTDANETIFTKVKEMARSFPNIQVITTKPPVDGEVSKDRAMPLSEVMLAAGDVFADIPHSEGSVTMTVAKERQHELSNNAFWIGFNYGH